MKREKSITIPEALWLELARYVIADPEPYDQIRHDACIKGIEAKLEAQIKHDLYTRYKTATPEQVEEARRAYCERAGIPESYRW